MKLLLKLLGVSDYIENLERLQKEDTDFITTLLTDKTELINKLKHTEQKLDNASKELNELLSTKTILTAQVIKLKEQLKTLEQSNSEYLSNNEDLISTNTNLLDIQNKLVNEIEFLCNRVIELGIANSTFKIKHND